MIKPLIIAFLYSIACQAQTTLERAKGFYEAKKYTDAETTLKLISKNHPDYAEAQYYLGRTALDQKKYDDAVDYFDEATKANPKAADYFSSLGDTYGTIAQNSSLFKQGLLAPKMKSAWEKAIALDSKNMSARLSLVQFYLQAPGFMGGSVDKAKETARQIIALKPAEGYQQMGNILNYEKRTEDAEKEYEKMAAADPAYNVALIGYYQNLKHYDKAFSFVENMLKKDPDDFAAIYQLGKTAALSGQKLELGERSLQKYLEHQPTKNEPPLSGANMRLAQIKEKSGRKSEAKKYFEIALKQDPTLKEAKEGLARLQ
jgi:tetratricopeptide (TPR) repeat protein